MKISNLNEQVIRNKYSKFFSFLENNRELKLDYEIYIYGNKFTINITPVKILNKLLIKPILNIEESDNIDHIPNIIFPSSISIQKNKNIKTIGSIDIFKNDDSPVYLKIKSLPSLKKIGDLNVGNGMNNSHLFLIGDIGIKTLKNQIISNNIELIDCNIDLQLKKYSQSNNFSNLSNSLSKYPKNLACNTFHINNIRIKNLYKYSIAKIKINRPSEHDEDFLLSNKLTLSSFNIIKQKNLSNILNNYLDLKSPNTLCGKLINEEYNLITKKEIKKYLNNKQYQINEEVSSYENKILVNIFDYCRTEKAYEFIIKSGYRLTKEELSTIKDQTISSLYKKALLKQKVRLNEQLAIMEKRKYKAYALSKEHPEFFRFIKEKKLNYKISETGKIIIYITNKIDFTNIINLDIDEIEKKSKTLFITDQDNLEYIPDNVIFHGNITIDSKILNKIGKNIAILGDFIIKRALNLKEIGEKLYIQSNFEMVNSLLGFKKTPDHMTVKGNLVLESIYLKEIGNNTKVHCFDNRTIMYKMPKNFHVKIIKIWKIKLKKIENICLDKLERIEMENVTIFKNPKNNKYISNEYYDEKDVHYKEAIDYNFLSLKAPNPLFRKLLNNEFHLITNKEIKKYLNNKIYLKNSENSFNIIDFCQNEKALHFLEKNKYHFTEDELLTIKNDKIKSLYEKILIKQNNSLKTIETNKLIKISNTAI